LAIVLSITAIVMAVTGSRNNKRLTEIQTGLNTELQALIDQSITKSSDELRLELVARLDGIIEQLGLAKTNPVEEVDLQEIAKLARTDPFMARQLQDGIEAVILKHMAAELVGVDWEGAVSSEEIQKLLRRAAKNTNAMPFGNMERVDVSDIDTAEGKINRILEEFEGLNSYSHNNALVQQMAEMGNEAIAPLLERLGNGNGSFADGFALNMAVTDTLEQLLTQDHEEIIIEEFTKHGHLAKLIEKYQFPAAEDEVMNKIAYPTHGHVDQTVIDAALKMNSERSVPILIEFVENGQNVSYAAEQLSIEGIDIAEPLQKAAARANGIWEQGRLAKLCLERDMAEGYDLAIAVFRSNEQHAEHSQKELYQFIRKETGLSGSYDEIADWLQENRSY
jgi:hypothetical protein